MNPQGRIEKLFCFAVIENDATFCMIDVPVLDRNFEFLIVSDCII